MIFTNNLSVVPFHLIVLLYESVGWSNYTSDPEGLRQALQNSTHLAFAMEGEQLVDLARSISDEVSIHYLQDILIHPDFQGKGLGHELINRCLDRFQNVRTHVILTDDEARQKKFYESKGYSNTKDLKKTVLNAYVKMKGLDLE